MLDKYSFQVRVTGILVMDKKLLLVKQKINSECDWSLPGGKAEAGSYMGLKENIGL